MRTPTTTNSSFNATHARQRSGSLSCQSLIESPVVSPNFHRQGIPNEVAYSLKYNINSNVANESERRIECNSEYDSGKYQRSMSTTRVGRSNVSSSSSARENTSSVMNQSDSSNQGFAVISSNVNRFSNTFYKQRSIPMVEERLCQWVVKYRQYSVTLPYENDALFVSAKSIMGMEFRKESDGNVTLKNFYNQRTGTSCSIYTWFYEACYIFLIGAMYPAQKYGKVFIGDRLDGANRLFMNTCSSIFEWIRKLHEDVDRQRRLERREAPKVVFHFTSAWATDLSFICAFCRREIEISAEIEKQFVEILYGNSSRSQSSKVVAIPFPCTFCNKESLIVELPTTYLLT